MIIRPYLVQTYAFVPCSLLELTFPLWGRAKPGQLTANCLGIQDTTGIQKDSLMGTGMEHQSTSLNASTN